MSIRNINIVFLTLFLLVCSAERINAQDEDPDTVGVGGFNWFAYPFVFFTPETNWAFGAGGVISFKLSDKDKSKPSSVTASGYYSVNSQFDITIQPEMYFAEDKLKNLQNYLEFALL